MTMSGARESGRKAPCSASSISPTRQPRGVGHLVVVRTPRAALADAARLGEDVIKLSTHGTTHVDAPWHYNSIIAGEKAQTIDELPLEWFFAPGVCLDFTTKEGRRRGHRQRRSNDALEHLDRDIQPHDIVLIRTGRDTFLE
ncbi:MAG: cyclase family protein, partial [Nitrospiraceae bacterium]|nr:cyclase family protein [Nitrospiraceae bacterium]